jgi:hypothetical protein
LREVTSIEVVLREVFLIEFVLREASFLRAEAEAEKEEEEEVKKIDDELILSSTRVSLIFRFADDSSSKIVEFFRFRLFRSFIFLRKSCEDDK